jgi:hypothetical protein
MPKQKFLKLANSSVDVCDFMEELEDREIYSVQGNEGVFVNEKDYSTALDILQQLERENEDN